MTSALINLEKKKMAGITCQEELFLVMGAKWMWLTPTNSGFGTF